VASWWGSGCGRRPTTWPRRCPPAVWPHRRPTADDDIRKRTWGCLLFGGHLGGGLLRRAPHGERARRHGDLLVAQRIRDGVDDGGGSGDRAGLAAALDAQRVRGTGRPEHGHVVGRKITRPRHTVVHVARGQQLAVLV